MDRVFQNLTPQREMTEDEKQHVQDVLDAALAWRSGEITGSVLLRMGMIEYQGRHDPEPMASPAYTRWLAIGWGIQNRQAGGMDDERWLALREFIDKLVNHKYVVTRQGVYQAAELHAHDDAIRYLRAGTTDRRDAA